jgi:hypothetical protein
LRLDAPPTTPGSPLGILPSGSGLSMRQIAARLGIDMRTVRRYLASSSPPPDGARRAAPGRPGGRSCCVRGPWCAAARDPLGLTCDFTAFRLAWAIVRLIFRVAARPLRRGSRRAPPSAADNAESWFGDRATGKSRVHGRPQVVTEKANGSCARRIPA